jgi:tocopherol O-methyltransferase
MSEEGNTFSSQTHEAALRRVVAYYDETYPEQRLLWMTSAARAIHLGFWERLTSNHTEALINMNRVLAARAGLRPGDLVLDAGCGVGGSAIWLAQQFGVRVVGVTVVRCQIDRAHRYARERGVADRVTFEHQDMTSTTFPDGSFDVVWALESLCHVPDKERFLAEARRLLKPAGRLVVASFFRHRRPFSPEDERPLRSCISGWAVPDLMTPEEFTGAARQTGFTTIRLEDVTANVGPSSRRAHRLAQVLYPVSLLLLRPLRLSTDRQLANARSARRQYQALQRGLWLYGIATIVA